jgi:hypothetical protein
MAGGRSGGKGGHREFQTRGIVRSPLGETPGGEGHRTAAACAGIRIEKSTDYCTGSQGEELGNYGVDYLGE